MNEFYTQIQYVFFCVLILKVVNIYIKHQWLFYWENPNVCVCHTLSLTHDYCGLKYMNILMNL